MKYFLLTFGCQMNKNDSERIAAMLLDLGFKPSEDYRVADLIILNTCSVRQSAEDRVYGMMKNFAALKRENSDLIIVVTGCIAGRDKDGQLKKRLPGVDIFLPTEDIVKLPEYLKQVQSSKFKVQSYLDIAPRYFLKSQVFVTIQTGCEEYCTYCVVPYARGKIKNRPLHDILNEIKKAVAAGAVEITLLGQIVNAWKVNDSDSFLADNPYRHPDPALDAGEGSPANAGIVHSGEILRSAQNEGRGFAALLWKINQIPGVKRLNFASAHPRYMTDEVIEAMTLPAHLNYLHLPVQSGSDKILQKMNRRYTAEEYLTVIKKVRAAKPDIALATDIIVGFPGETEEDFEATIELYKKCDFDIAYLAKYSPRSGTPAFRAQKDDVPREEKTRRWRVLQNLMEESTLRKNQKYLRCIVEVLVESCADGVCAGNSREMKLTRFSGNADLVGKIVNVKINKAKEWVLFGEAAF